MNHTGSKKKILFIACAAALVCAISASGTLAYLTATKSGTDALTNTFVAAGGGYLIDPDPTEPSPAIPTGLNKGFYLVESKATYNTTTSKYTLDASSKVTSNTYDKGKASMEIPKDPALTLDIKTGVDAYVFMAVEDTSNTNLKYYIGSAWTTLSGVTIGNAQVYVYNSGKAVTGVDGADLSSVALLQDDKVTVNDYPLDIDSSTAGVQYGNLTFTAYVCQAANFTDAAAAFKACFGN